MKKSKKNFLGAIGLSAVAATTIYASTIPAPGASALSSTITDTLTVRVVSPEASVVMSPLQDVILEAPGYNFNVAYANVSRVIVTISRIGAQNTDNILYTIWNEDVDFATGIKEFAINLTDYGGYGHYILTSKGIDLYGLPASEQSIELTYSEPVVVDPNGDVNINVPTSPEAEVDSAVIKIIDKDGEVVAEIPVDNPGDAQNINLNDYDLPDGTYTIETEYYDENGNEIPNSSTSTTVIKDDDETTSNVDLGNEAEEAASVVITVKDPETGEVKKTIEIENPSPNEEINLDGLDTGEYDVEIEYKNEQGETIGTGETTVEKKDDPSTVPVTIEPQGEEVAKVIIEVKDEDGNVVKTVEVENPGSEVPISTGDLPTGEYTIDVTYIGEGGNEIGETSTSDVTKDSPTTGKVEVEDKGDNVDKIIVTVTDPDTGEVKKVIEVENPGTGEVKIDLDGLDAGEYDVTIDYYDGDQKVGESETTTTKPEDKTAVPVEVPQSENVDKVVVEVKNEQGETVKVVEIENPGDKIEVSTDDLPAGNYTFDSTFYDESGTEIVSTETNVTKTDNTGSVDVDIPAVLNEVEDIVVNVYDKDGNLVQYAVVTETPDGKKIYKVYDPSGRLIRTDIKEQSDTSLSLPLDGLESGNYAIEIVYRNDAGEIVGEPTTTVVNYEAPDNSHAGGNDTPAGTPDTGGLFKNLDVSRADYLVTALLVFFIFGIVGLGVIIHNRKSAKFSKKRR